MKKKIKEWTTKKLRIETCTFCGKESFGGHMCKKMIKFYDWKVEQEPTHACIYVECPHKGHDKDCQCYEHQPKTEDQIVLGKNGHYDCNNPKCPNFPHKPKTEGRCQHEFNRYSSNGLFCSICGVEYKTEGRECGHGFDNCAICWGGQHNKWCNHTGSPKQDTWESVIREHKYTSKLSCNCEDDYECQRDLIGFIRSELQNQRQEIKKAIEENQMPIEGDFIKISRTKWHKIWLDKE